MSGFLGRRHFGCAFCAAAAIVATACTPGDRSGPAAIAPGYKPAAGTDEAGLRSVMDRAEDALRSSPMLVRDPALTRYVSDIACRLAPAHCPDLRVYVIRTPHFNASMAPNGMMEVWTGLLLRVQDEAQLAAVIGHELGHYLERHGFQRFRSIRKTADYAAFLSMGLSLAGPIGSIGNDLAQAALVAGLFAYSREQERQADRIGSELMGRAGFAQGRAADLWEQLIAEMAAAPDPRPRDIFTATHPDPRERVNDLRARVPAGDAGDRGRERLRAALAALRGTLLQDEVRLRQPARSLVLFEQLRASGLEDATLVFTEGEVIRLRDGDGDPARAVALYERALSMPNPPVETWRSLGLVARRTGDGIAAQAAFRRYLELAPDAGDRRIIESYLSASG